MRHAANVPIFVRLASKTLHSQLIDSIFCFPYWAFSTSALTQLELIA